MAELEGNELEVYKKDILNFKTKEHLSNFLEKNKGPILAIETKSVLKEFKQLFEENTSLFKESISEFTQAYDNRIKEIEINELEKYKSNISLIKDRESFNLAQEQFIKDTGGIISSEVLKDFNNINSNKIDLIAQEELATYKKAIENTFSKEDLVKIYKKFEEKIKHSNNENIVLQYNEIYKKQVAVVEANDFNTYKVNLSTITNEDGLTKFYNLYKDRIKTLENRGLAEKYNQAYSTALPLVKEKESKIFEKYKIDISECKTKEELDQCYGDVVEKYDTSRLGTEDVKIPEKYQEEYNKKIEFIEYNDLESFEEQIKMTKNKSELFKFKLEYKIERTITPECIEYYQKYKEYFESLYQQQELSIEENDYNLYLDEIQKCEGKEDLDKIYKLYQKKYLPEVKNQEIKVWYKTSYTDRLSDIEKKMVEKKLAEYSEANKESVLGYEHLFKNVLGVGFSKAYQDVIDQRLQALEFMELETYKKELNKIDNSDDLYFFNEDYMEKIKPMRFEKLLDSYDKAYEQRDAEIFANSFSSGIKETVKEEVVIENTEQPIEDVEEFANSISSILKSMEDGDKNDKDTNIAKFKAIKEKNTDLVKKQNNPPNDEFKFNK